MGTISAVLSQPRYLEMMATTTNLLDGLAIREDLLDGHVEFAHIVVPEAVLVPTHRLQQHILWAIDRQLERNVPFRVEIFVDDRSRLIGITKVQHQKLFAGSISSSHPKGSHENTHWVTCAALVLRCKTSSLDHGRLQDQPLGFRRRRPHRTFRPACPWGSTAIFTTAALEAAGYDMDHTVLRDGAPFVPRERHLMPQGRGGGRTPKQLYYDEAKHRLTNLENLEFLDEK